MDSLISPRAQALISKYTVPSDLRGRAESSYRATLGVLDLLDRIPESLLPENLGRVLDVGSASWNYLGALMLFAKAESFTGVEVLGKRLTWNLSTLEKKAKQEIEYWKSQPEVALTPVTYLTGELANLRDRFDTLTWFFPYLSLETHQAGGLSKKAFNPKAMIEKANATGARHLILFNQGEWEWSEAESLFGEYWTLQFQEVVEGSLHPSPYPVSVSVWTRNSSSQDQ